MGEYGSKRYGGKNGGDRGYRSGGGKGGHGNKRGGRKPQRYDLDPERLAQKEDLLQELRRLDGASYGAYKKLVGTYAFDGFDLTIYRVQSDPYAPPSQVAVRFDTAALEIPDGLVETKATQVAVADFLARSFKRELGGYRDLQMAPIGQEILERSYSKIDTEEGEIRFQVQLPARGRTILGRVAQQIIGSDIPRVVEDALYGHDREALRRHVETYLDYLALQQIVAEKDWVAFVADGSNLARESGISDRPLEGGVLTCSPEGLAETVELPFAGKVRGMAIPAGVTLIVGGGYHGKSTLLQALARAVYAHVPADGREQVATTTVAVPIRAEDGRAVTGVDLRPFIGILPQGRSTENFSTENASGSTSQAAAIIEALEVGAGALLIDEDTSATNLMIRDRRMRALVAAEAEPITPLVDRIRALRQRGVSTVLVMGGSGDYLDHADRVIGLKNYELEDLTEAAHEVCEEMPVPPGAIDDDPAIFETNPRVPVPAPSRDDRGYRVKSRRTQTITIDKEEIDVSALVCLVDPGQTEAVGQLIKWGLNGGFDSSASLSEVLDRAETLIKEGGLDTLASGAPAFLVRPRRFEVAGALNRYRRLKLN